jgi:hypothetical protein
MAAFRTCADEASTMMWRDTFKRKSHFAISVLAGGQRGTAFTIRARLPAAKRWCATAKLETAVANVLAASRQRFATFTFSALQAVTIVWQCCLQPRLWATIRCFASGEWLATFRTCARGAAANLCQRVLQHVPKTTVVFMATGKR